MDILDFLSSFHILEELPAQAVNDASKKGSVPGSKLLDDSPLPPPRSLDQEVDEKAALFEMSASLSVSFSTHDADDEETSRYFLEKYCDLLKFSCNQEVNNHSRKVDRNIFNIQFKVISEISPEEQMVLQNETQILILFCLAEGGSKGSVEGSKDSTRSSPWYVLNTPHIRGNLSQSINVKDDSEKYDEMAPTWRIVVHSSTFHATNLLISPRLGESSLPIHEQYGKGRKDLQKLIDYVNDVGANRSMNEYFNGRLEMGKSRREKEKEMEDLHWDGLVSSVADLQSFITSIYSKASLDSMDSMLGLGYNFKDHSLDKQSPFIPPSTLPSTTSSSSSSSSSSFSASSSTSPHSAQVYLNQLIQNFKKVNNR